MKLPDGYQWAERLDETEVKRGAQRHEWVSRVFQYVNGSSGYHATGSTGGIIYQPAPGSPSVALYLPVDDKQDAKPYIIGTDGIARNEVAIWRDAVIHANKNMGKTEPFKWLAFIGTDPQDLRSSGVQLSGTMQIGHLRLTPSEKPFPEWWVHRTQINQASPIVTGLVQVHGTSRAFSRQVVLEVAASELRQLTALLSVATSRCWIVRDGPNPRLRTDEKGTYEFDDLVEFPTSSPWLKDFEMSEGNLRMQNIEVPEWVDSAWQMIRSRSWLSRLVLALQEGLMLEPTHPSWACVAYVAVIEQIGKRGSAVRHKSLRHNQPGAMDAFRRALNGVLSPESVRTLAQLYYGDRSKTAHEGRLHGNELTFGRFFQLDTFDDYFLNTFARRLDQLRHISCFLLQRELRPRVTP